MHSEKANASSMMGAGIGRGAGMVESAHAEGHYVVECIGADGRVKWRDEIKNIVTTEGKNALLTNGFKGSAFTQTMYLGLINGTNYSAVAATNVAASITVGAAAGPANGWNEVAAATVAARGTPSFGTASAGSLALASAVSFSVLATDTIKGCFLMMKSSAGVAPTSAVGNTNGAIYSAGLFSGGDKSVQNGDTLNVSYTASL